MAPNDTYVRFTSRDPLLLVGLYSGNHEVVAGVTRLLRLTPLSLLAHYRSALVEVLAALPELHDRLRASWARTDPALAAQFFLWAEQARLHAQRIGHDVEKTTGGRPVAFMRTEDLLAA